MATSSNLVFKNSAGSFTMGINSYPGPGSGLFHMGNAIHFGGGGITFSTGYSPEYTGPFAISKYSFRGGLSSFDSVFTSKIGIGMYGPVGYGLGVYGPSYFKIRLLLVLPALVCQQGLTNSMLEVLLSAKN